MEEEKKLHLILLSRDFFFFFCTSPAWHSVLVCVCVFVWAFAVKANASSELQNIVSTICITLWSRSYMVREVIMPSENILKCD